MDSNHFDNEALPTDRQCAPPSVDNPGESNLEKSITEGNATVGTKPEEWRSQEGEELLDAVLDDGDRMPFNRSSPYAEEARVDIEMSVKLRVQELREAGKGRKASLLVRAFRRLKEGAPETPTQREIRSSSPGDAR